MQDRRQEAGVIGHADDVHVLAVGEPGVLIGAGARWLGNRRGWILCAAGKDLDKSKQMLNSC
jgi:hypothetical protein